MKLIKIFIVLLALSGVVALVLASRLTARPVTAMTAIQPSMNFAYVRVSGLITQYPMVDEKHETLSFRLVDESNDIRVSVYGAVLRDLLARQQVPQPGQRIDLEQQPQNSPLKASAACDEQHRTIAAPIT